MLIGISVTLTTEL